MGGRGWDPEIRAGIFSGLLRLFSGKETISIQIESVKTKEKCDIASLQCDGEPLKESEKLEPKAEKDIQR